MSIEEVIEQFPVTRDQIDRLMAFVARSLEKEPAYSWSGPGMLILFDNGTPRGLAHVLVGHVVEEARLHGWEELANGELIEAAEFAGFEILVTTDKTFAISGTSRAAESRWWC
jgi:hypothetical protein